MAIGCWKACCRVVRVHGWRGAHAWCVRVERALHACARRVCSCKGRRAASAEVAVVRRSPVHDMPLSALAFFLLRGAKVRNAKRAYIARSPIGSPIRLVLLGPELVLAATATLHLHMGRKPFTEAAKERRRTRTMEALLPRHLLHGDDDCNRCVTTGAASRGMLGLWWPLRAPHAPHASCCILLCCTVTHRGCARRSRLCTVAQCLRTPLIRRTHSPFTAPSVTGALPFRLAACVVKGCKSTRRISARLRRLGRFLVAAATPAHLQWTLRPSCN